MDRSLSEKLKTITLLVLDVDGVLTDGKIIIDDRGNESKNFNVRDGHGLRLLMRGGVDILILTGRRSEVVQHRANELGIKDVYQGVHDKAKVLGEILNERGLSGDSVAYMGDDIVDLPVFRIVGFSAAVADALDYVKEESDYVSKKKGGDGAVREICEMILVAQGKWSEVTERYGVKISG
ncbi:MAG TPA: HAD hydrolase family protein [Syntrophales bacterium]|nr:HAD hydrolase family protein [Syntrophales bacterium]HPQ44975.1 HAD hydrolase family protein [Syntrophales bacterium]